MIRRGRRAAWPTAALGRADETESLHTDVMRFMAILGLCLTAIFALVQSVSVRESAQHSELERDDALEQDIIAMEDKAHSMQLKLDRLAATIDETLESKEAAVQALTLAQEQLAVVISDKVHRTDERDRIKVELEGIERELLQRRRELDRIRQVSGEKHTTLAGLAHRLEQEQRKLDRIEERVEAAKVKRAVAARSPARVKQPVSEVQSTRQGFTLRFASEAALDRLIAKAEVTLYGMSGEDAWRLASGTGKPVFVRVEFPRKFHEMASDTVPTDYVSAFRRLLQGEQAMSVTWGVKLPSHTEQRIATLTRQLTGGTLVIGPDGQVETQQNGPRE